MPFWRKEDKGRHAQDPQALVVRREYDKAVKAYRALLASQPGNYVLSHKIADVLCLAGRERESLQNYSIAADGYAREGFLIKAIAILKKMQRIDPADLSVERRVAELSASDASVAARTAAPRPAGTMPRPAPESVGGPDLTFDMEEAEERPPIPLSPMEAEPAAPVAPAPGRPEAAAPVVSTPLFSDFTSQELREVVARLRHREFRAGSVLVREGEPGDSLFVVCEGRVKVTTQGPKGEAVDLAELTEGDFFGEVSLLTGKPRTATITSVADTEVLELTREDLSALEARRPRVRKVIQEFYERRVEATVEAMIAARRSRKPTSRR